MRTKRSYGRPGTRVIPPGWGASHAPVVNARLSAVVSLTDPATASEQWDEDTQRTILTATPYAAGVPAAVQVIFNGSPEIAGEELLQVAGYRVTLPHDHMALPTHQVTVTTCDGDTSLVGRVLAVVEVLRGSERFQRDLMCRLTN